MQQGSPAGAKLESLQLHGLHPKPLGHQDAACFVTFLKMLKCFAESDALFLKRLAPHSHLEAAGFNISPVCCPHSVVGLDPKLTALLVQKMTMRSNPGCLGMMFAAMWRDGK